MSIVEDMSGLPGPEDDVKDLTRHQHQGEHGFNIDWHVLGEKRFAVPLLCNIAIALGLSPEALLLDPALRPPRQQAQHYGSLYVNGAARPTLLQGARGVETQRPNAEASDAHRRRHMQPCDANGVLGGAEWKVKGKAQVQAYPPISSRPTYGACMYC
jgi:hypothetical protein